MGYYGSDIERFSPGPDQDMSSSLSSSTSGLSGGRSSTRLSSPFEDQTVGTGIKLKTVPEFTIDDRITHLNKFEVGLLTPPQIKEFNEVFTGRDILYEEPLFKSWLILKLATIPTESEVLKRIMADPIYSIIPKKKKKESSTEDTFCEKVKKPQST